MSFLRGTELARAAKARIGRREFSAMCQAFVLNVSKSGTGTPDFDRDGDHDAVDAWKRAAAHGKVVHARDIKDVSKIPTGTLAYWKGGSRGYGHAAITVRGGKIVSTDAPVWGVIGSVSVGWIAQNWGLTFLGYLIEDAEGHVFVPPRVVKRRVLLKDSSLALRAGIGWHRKIVTRVDPGKNVIDTGLRRRSRGGRLWGKFKVTRDGRLVAGWAPVHLSKAV